ncbi:MAG: hypothetical protein FWC50_02280 [Planctomycetaceae bacterium]|nr:hypothetical protein [Planctomycetaceae bacterium]
MKSTDIPTDNPLEMVWAIREKIYEETKDMTPEEEREYTRKQSEAFRRLMKEVNPGDYDLSFLHTKVEKQEVSVR